MERVLLGGRVLFGGEYYYSPAGGKNNVDGRKVMLVQINIGGESKACVWIHSGKRGILVKRVILVGKDNVGGRRVMHMGRVILAGRVTLV